MRLLRMAATGCLFTCSAIAAQPPNTGGPDTFGYKYIDKRAAGGPLFNFIDISPSGSAPGTSSTVSEEFDASEAVDIGFNFKFYDNDYTACFIVSHGFLRFAAPSTDYTPEPLPQPTQPNNIIAGFWTDLDAREGASTGGGDVYYKTIGAEPNRKFIVQYENVAQTGADQGTRSRATFQIQLFEGSNVIEVHYKDIQQGQANLTELFTIGIENINGTSGLQYLHGNRNTNHGDIPTRPHAVRFERPVVVTVESEYLRPGTSVPTDTVSTDVSPGVGVTKADYQSVQRFEAPEFIYLDRNAVELSEIGTLDLTNLGANDVAWYRLRNVGYAIDGEAVQGVERFFERTITRDLKVIWKWEIDYALIVDSATGESGFGDPMPAIGRTWLPKDTEIAPSIDSVVESEGDGFRFRTAGYEVFDEDGTLQTTQSRNPEDSRAVTDPITIGAPRRVKWLWNGQVRYRFDASSGLIGESPGEFDGQSFARYTENGTLKTTFGKGALTPVWIDEGTPVVVGAFYRDIERCFTLADFNPGGSPAGDLSSLGTDISVLPDSQAYPDEAGTPNRVSRIFNVTMAERPTDIHWNYQPTIYRAEIPFGEALDAANPNARLVPDLCQGAVLSDAGPDPLTTFLQQVGNNPTVEGDPLEWDKVGKQLFPVIPGSNRIRWQDQSNGRNYLIEIVGGYPGNDVPLVSERENENGLRQGSAPAYVMETTLARVDASFPGSIPAPDPGDAHYRVLYDSDPTGARTPPTKLDLSTSDRWAFQKLTYSDAITSATTNDGQAGIAFNTSGAGRSVLLYSQRPNPGEAANGNLDEEKLAVRVVRSEAIQPIQPEDDRYVLGKRGLDLGGSDAADGAYGIVQRGAGTTPFYSPTQDFVVDFWLNAKGLRTDDGPVKILTTNGGDLEVTLDAGSSTITATYRGINVVQPFSTAGAAWRHHIIHVFNNQFFGIDLTVVNFYIDGERAEQAIVTALLPDSSRLRLIIGTGVGPESVRFGVGADPFSGLQFDQFRLFNMFPTNNRWLTPGELRKLRTVQDMQTDPDDRLRGFSPAIWFGFEQPPDASSFANDGVLPDLGVGPVPADPPVPDDPAIPGDQGRPGGIFAGSWARLDIQEVATRLDSTLDNADFGGSGYVLNRISNYNANLYDRSAEVGTWGPLFPVNRTEGLFVDTPDQKRRLEVAYYENPFLIDPDNHPNVAWPYLAAAYDRVTYPKFGPHKDKRIYIASRIGSEGVDSTGRPQQIYNLDKFSDLQIYNQPERSLAGFNPNEEHALVAASSRPGLKIKNLGEGLANNPPLAAFALQKDINAASEAIVGYTSDPWVLVQVNNLLTGEPEMAAYQVDKFRIGLIAFPRPPDSVVNATDGLAYESAPNPEDRFLVIGDADNPDLTYDFSYAFSFPVFAGDLLIPPYPLNLVVGNVRMQDDKGSNESTQRTFWRDVNGNGWVISGDGRFVHQFHYPFRSDFFLPQADGTDPVEPGAPVAWLPDQPLVGSPQFTGENLKAGRVTYVSKWRTSYPKLKRGETLTYQGGEYFNENPGSNGLPALVAMKAAEIVFDVATPDMQIGADNVDAYSARIIRPLDRHEERFTVTQMSAAGFSPAATSKIFVVAERWYFKALPGSLQRRFYFDSLAEKLVFRGYLNDKDSGDSELTLGPDPINVLEPNVITDEDLERMNELSDDGDWTAAVDLIHRKSQNPMRIRKEVAGRAEEFTGEFLPGVKEAPLFTQRLGLVELGTDLTEAQARLDRLAALQKELGAVLVFVNADNLSIDFEGQVITLGSALADVRASKAELEMDISSYGYTLEDVAPAADRNYVHLDSFGVGSALVCNPDLLTALVTGGSRYITIAENNREELDGAPVSLHIIEIVPDRYRGAIKVIEGADAFSEKVTLQHNGDFGTNTRNLYYEWWIRDAAPLGVINHSTDPEIRADGTLKDVDDRGTSLWQQYIPPSRESFPEPDKHLGLHTIVFEGRPDVTLADKLVLMRYRHKTESDWKLVPFEPNDPVGEWAPGSPAPFQWAGAANSPQLQASGEKLYIPQLVMGWVKRILDRINPYEARYTDFFSNESPAVYSSMIQIVGPPFAGKVALNPDKNVIENTGLIELYETVLARARELSIDNSSNPSATDGINQALLLAATRLAVLYEILAREAYSDAQDSTISVTSEDPGLASVVSFTHAFQNFEADLMHEELALLRGTDFRKSFPVYNRLFWNFAKGLGEAAYSVNYNIYDANTDGFINEDDARILYPQGHGDSWGYFMSALGMHYTLLQHPVFSWKTRSELYALLQNVLEVDFLDEKTFAELAAARASAGRDIVRGTYRQHYTQDPDGQWHGYTDSADPARAWGVSEWAHRTGQATYFDFAVANSLLPEEAEDASPVENPENLDRLERDSAADDIGAIAAGLHEIQIAMDEANGGVNPLGFDSDAIAFDIDPFFDGLEWQRRTHFEQVYERALVAGQNAMATIDFAAKAGNKLRFLENDTETLIVEAFRQDLDYRNRLIEIFGRPYDGTIGFGKVFPEGYEGPDTQLFAYLNHTSITQIIPETDATAPTTMVRFQSTFNRAAKLADRREFITLYGSVFGNPGLNLANVLLKPVAIGADTVGGSAATFTFGPGGGNLSAAFGAFLGNQTYEDFSSTTPELLVPVRQTSPYAFQAPEEWGQRTSYGTLQRILEEELKERIALDSAIAKYVALLQEFEVATHRLEMAVELADRRAFIGLQITGAKRTAETATKLLDKAIAVAETAKETTDKGADAGQEAIPTQTPIGGLAVGPGDVAAPARGAVKAAATGISTASKVAAFAAKAAKAAINFTKERLIDDLKEDKARIKEVNALNGLLVRLTALAGREEPLRNAIGKHVLQIDLHRQAYLTAQAEGFRLLREREAFNKVLAAKAQRNRYQDMIFRMARNEAMSRYQASFHNAARYAWLAARAYDYETSLDPGNPAAPGPLLDRIVRERQLGLWADGQPQAGQGGLAEILNHLNGNFQVLKGQLGLNNPQAEVEKISLRSELFRIGPAGMNPSDMRWQDALKARIEPDLLSMPEFKRHCRPFAEATAGPQPGIVIRFGTIIEPGLNFFGQPLAQGDHSYSTANFATKIRGFGTWLENYNAAGLSTTPRAYLVPVGNDSLRTSSSAQPFTRVWNVLEQRIPTPFITNPTDLTSPRYIPSLNGVDGGFSELRRHGDFRMYHDGGGAVDESELILDSRLIGRSVWNSDWMLIIPGAGLHVDPMTGLTELANNVSDIKLHFRTYSHQGQ